LANFFNCVIIDAEESWVQDVIDHFAEKMMALYNKETAIIFNTLQFYRWDRLNYLKKSIKEAESSGYQYGIKLVRGAYLEKEKGRAEELGYNLIELNPSSIATSYVHGAVGNIGKVFEPYYTTKSDGKGTGLGLSVVYGIVKSHSGEIKIKSEINKGTSIEIYFPLINEIAEIEVKNHKNTKIGGNEKILVVDDEPAITKVLKRLLGNVGYDVTLCNDSRVAIDIFKNDSDSFDLVITDMTMPFITGDKLSETLLSIKPEIPIIICTGYSERIDKEKAEKIGIKTLLMKPIESDDLLKVIRNILD
jgi:CheY-like chemotaxis protein